MTTNPFERHGIAHLSPSSLRLYREEPAAWVVKYLFRVKDESGPGAWRGLAVEKGLDTYLYSGGDGNAAHSAMHTEFERLATGLADDKTVKERANLDDFLKQSIMALSGQPMPLHRQKRIEVRLPGIEVPLIGFVDYEWPQFGIDLKTTMRLPSEPQPAHVEQMAVYMQATGKPFSLLYATPKKSAVYEVTKDMAVDALERVQRGANAIRHMLALAETPHDAAAIFSPDMSSFYWSEEMIAKAKEIYSK